MYNELFPLTYYFYPLLEGDYQPGAHHERIDAVLRTVRAVEPESLLYVHIPYCHDLCQFCPFHIKVANQTELYERRLREEIGLLATYPSIAGRRFRAVYFCGGSPSIFGAVLIGRVLDAIHAQLSIADDAEISFEGEPADIGRPGAARVARVAPGARRVADQLRAPDLRRGAPQAVPDPGDARRRRSRHRQRPPYRLRRHNVRPAGTDTALHRDLAVLKRARYDSVDYYNLHYYAFPKTFKAAMDRGEIPAKPSTDVHFAMAQEIRWRMAELGYGGVADQVYSKKPSVCEYFRLLWGGGNGDHAAETIAVGARLRARAVVHEHRRRRGVRVVDRSPAAVGGQGLAPARSRRGVHAQVLPDREALRRLRKTIRPEIWSGWLATGLMRETPDAYEITERGRL